MECLLIAFANKSSHVRFLIQSVNSTIIYDELLQNNIRPDTIKQLRTTKENKIIQLTPMQEEEPSRKIH